MRITCPTCDTSYKLAEGALRGGGRKVRCTRCATVWFARPDEPPRDELAAEQEWSAVEAATPSPPPGPSDDDWRAALSEPDEAAAPEPAAAGSQADPEDGEAAAGGTDAAFDPVDETEPLPSGATAASAGNLVPLDAASGRKEAPAAEPAVIDADPPGFSPRPAASRRSLPAKGSGGRRRIGARFASTLVVALAGAALVAVVAGAFLARDELVRQIPDLAGLYGAAGLDVNLRGLAFSKVRSWREVEGATPVLVVEGEIQNIDPVARPVPRLRFALRSNLGREVYAWTMDPAAGTLEPGERTRFKSRLPTPPDAAADIQVRFTDRRGP